MDARGHAPRDPTRQREVGKQHSVILAPPDPIQPKALVITRRVLPAPLGHFRHWETERPLRVHLAPKAKVVRSNDGPRKLIANHVPREHMETNSALPCASFVTPGTTMIKPKNNHAMTNVNLANTHRQGLRIVYPVSQARRGFSVVSPVVKETLVQVLQKIASLVK